ncbi:MAG: hypothetical protein KGL46_01965 [Hyphomicrobiales bacterium]|nr:hypothetical protein [Hyphomicrobiales bacterium]
MREYSLSFAPLLPYWALIALAVAGALAVALSIWARRPGAMLRAAGLGLLLFGLSGPSLVREDREALRDIVALVLDHSGSQTLGERTKQMEAARAELEKRIGALGDIDLRVIDSARDGPDSDGTKLFAALASGLADVPPERLGAVLMVTDGVVHDIPESVDKLGFRAPLHVLVTGREGEIDRRIELVEAPRFGIVGKELVIEARVIDTRAGAEPALVHVRRDGADVATLRAIPGEKTAVRVKIDHGGPNVVELEVDPLPGELTALNNRAVLTIDGVRDKLKVLLVSGEPHAGERAWRNLLRSDANVDLVHFTILRPPEKQDGTPISELALIAFPTADLFGRKIKDFDLIIFDRYSNQSILPSVYLENIVRYVQDGGALLIAAGPDFATADGIFNSPLGKITPAAPQGSLTERAFRAHVSDIGRKHPVTRALPGSASEPPQWSDWFRLVNAETTRGVAVMNGAGGKPLLVLSREGKGRVAELLTDQMWLWARGYQGGGPYLDLMRRLAHWMMKEPDLEEEALRARARGRDLTVERQTLKDTVEPVTIVAPSGARDELTLANAEPGLDRGHWQAKEMGLHRLSSGALSVLVNVGPDNPREFQNVVSTLDLLAPIAEASGGTIRRIAAGDQGAIAVPRVAAVQPGSIYGGSDWIGVRRTQTSVARGVAATPLALGALALVLLLAAILGGWIVESFRRT